MDLKDSGRRVARVGELALGEPVGATHAIYAFYFASACFVWPFLPLFLARRVDDAQLGLLLGACRLVQVAVTPLAAFAADARLGRGAVFAVFWLLWQCATVALPLTAPRGALVALTLARAAAEAPMMPFINSGVLARLELGSGDFGKSRLFGSIAWGGLAPVAGLVFTKYGFSANVAASVLLSCGTAAVATLVVPREVARRKRVGQYAAVSETAENPFAHATPYASDELEDELDYASDPTSPTAARASNESPLATAESLERRPETVEDTDEPRVNPFELEEEEEDDDEAGASDGGLATQPGLDATSSLDVRLLARRLGAFLPCVVAIGCGFGFVMNFLFVFIKRELGGSASLCGAALLVECLVEVPCLRYADWALERYGARRLLLTVLLLYVARCAGYAAVALFAPTRPALILLVEPLHGITFALFYTAGVVHAKELVNDERWATLAQGLFSFAFTAGSGLGAALGGLLVQRVGFARTFLLFSLFFLASSALFVSACELDESHATKKKRPHSFERVSAPAHDRRTIDPDDETPTSSALGDFTSLREWDDEAYL